MAVSPAVNEIPIRFILAGSCHPYSGRQTMFTIPFDEKLTMEAMIMEYVSPNWPSELPELKKSLKPTQLKLLKSGRSLDMKSLLVNNLSIEETTRLKNGSSNDEARMASAVLIHLVFLAPLSSVEESLPVVEQRKPVAEKADSGCCSLM
eukprot:GILI01023405.1.p1 GENE.GILI01023405.1~~GILI01023405.1.p1  ORF type:complete len:163 (+),score=4.01 GILI01023405.1:43-489(+)